MKVTVAHMRKAKICKDVKRFFFDVNGLDWRDFIKNGIDSDVLRKFNHPMANRVCDIAEKE